MIGPEVICPQSGKKPFRQRERREDDRLLRAEGNSGKPRSCGWLMATELLPPSPSHHPKSSKR